MDKDKAAVVVDQLTAWNVPATVVPVGMHSAAVRVRLGGGREALWDAAGTAGLDAQVLRDGVLVGSVAELPGSAALPAGHQAWLIATAHYDLMPHQRPDLVRPAVPPVAAPAVGAGWTPRRRLLRSGDAHRGGGLR